MPSYETAPSPEEVKLEAELARGPKPISIEVSTQDVQMLFACGTNPDQFNQLLLAKLKDAGGPVEGVLTLKLAHGKLFKLKDSIFEEQTCFTYIWLPDEYVAAIANGAVNEALPS